jgi:ABC-type sugar transport system ATPase subunit
VTHARPVAPAEGGPAAAPLLRAVDVVRDFPGLRALDRVSLEVVSGEIVALVGHNGSGKSTLVKILAGVDTADTGRIELAELGGTATELHVIHQDLGLVSELTAVENLKLAPDPDRSRLAPNARAREREHTLALISRFGEPFDVDVPIARLAPAQRSIIAIARALDGWKHERNVLILDEPTEALHASEVEVLFEAVRRTAAAGAGVVFISHRLDEVLDLAERVVVLRNGCKVADLRTGDLDHETLVTHVTGSEVHHRPDTARERGAGEVALEIVGLTGPQVHGFDLTLRHGEVVGMAGVLGSGRDALPSLVFGAVPASARSFRVGGRDYVRRSPRASVRRGMAFVAGDRAVLGAVPAMNARENMTLPDLRPVTSPFGALRRRAERTVAGDLARRYDVRPPEPERGFAQFSGGNQQKIVFAKWLRNEPRVLLLEEPTQGVDIGAKQFIYGEIDAAAARGVAVLVCSSDAKELVRLCDRVAVMRNGVVVTELSGDRLTESALVAEGYGLTTTSTP